METALKYLKNPMDVGVYNLLFTVDFSNVKDFVEGFRKEIEDVKNGRNTSTLRFKSRINTLEDIKNKLENNSAENEREYFKTIFDSLTSVYSNFEQVPNELENVFLTRKQIGKGTFLIERSQSNIFESHIVKNNADAISICKTWITGNKWLFDILSLKQETCIQQIELLKKIPSLTINITKDIKQHFSTRYSNRLYSRVVQLWLGNDVSSIIPHDLKTFLSGASRYISSEEWRTSIVLSAIAVESVLADLYEEVYRKPAPDVPLGTLFIETSKKCNFPQEIIKAEEMTNSARIAAVHRSAHSVSEKDSINALFGATNFIIWYHAQ